MSEDNEIMKHNDTLIMLDFKKLNHVLINFSNHGTNLGVLLSHKEWEELKSKVDKGFEEN